MNIFNKKQTKMTNAEPNTSSSKKSHKPRTFFSWIFGILAIILILLSTVVIWINRTIIDTGTYVSTVSSVIAKPDVQDYIANQVTDQFIKNVSIDQLAPQLLTPAEVSNDSSQQQKNLVRPIIYSNLVSILTSRNFYNLWVSTNTSAHQEFINELKSGAPTISLDLHPAIDSVINQFKQSKLSPISNKINIAANVGKVTIKGNQAKKFAKYYKYLRNISWAVVSLATFCAILMIVISPMRIKAVKRLTATLAIVSLIIIVILNLPKYISIKTHNPAQEKAAVAVAISLFSKLIEYMLILLIISVVIFVALEVIPRLKKARAKVV
jgi:hypothetical protein